MSASTERHPKGLYVLFGTEMWERFSFYTMMSMLALYMKDPKEGFNWSTDAATDVSSWYQACVYASPLIGGLLADRYLGARRAITIGGFFFIAGHLLLAFPNVSIFYLALVCLVTGNGFFKPNVSSLVGNLYPEGSRLKDSAYLIFYMGINIGATLGPIIAEFVQRGLGFHIAFAVAAIGMVISLITFWSYGHLVQDKTVVQQGTLTTTPEETVAVAEDVPPATRPRPAIEDVPEWKRLAALIVIFIIVIVFWMIFHQNSTTLTFWANDCTDWKVSGIISNAINPTWIILLALPLVQFWSWLDRRGLEPSTPTKMTIGMVLTGISCLILYAASATAGYSKPVARVAESRDGIVYINYGKPDQEGNDSYPRQSLGITVPVETFQLPVDEEDPDSPTKAVELTPARVESGTLAKGSLCRIERIESGMPVVVPVPKVSPLWLIIAYLVISLGELMLSPMGLALVSKVAPARMRGLMMGGWFLATAIGNKLTSIGGYWDVWSHNRFFLTLAAMAFAVAVLLLVLIRPLKRAMPGV